MHQGDSSSQCRALLSVVWRCRCGDVTKVGCHTSSFFVVAVVIVAVVVVVFVVGVLLSFLLLSCYRCCRYRWGVVIIVVEVL